MKRAFRTRSIALLLGLTMALLSVSVAFAAPPQPVHIEVEEYIGVSGETFDASGAVCSKGTVDDLTVYLYGPTQGPYRFLYVLKRFYCDGGSGTFDIEMKVKLENATGNTTAHWKLVAGTGPYANLKGNGSLVGTAIVQGTSIYDIYDGKVH